MELALAALRCHQRPRLFPSLWFLIFSGSFSVTQKARWLWLVQTWQCEKEKEKPCHCGAVSQRQANDPHLYPGLHLMAHWSEWAISESVTGKEDGIILRSVRKPWEPRVGWPKPMALPWSTGPCAWINWVCYEGKWSLDEGAIHCEWWGEPEWLVWFYFSFYCFFFKSQN